MARPVLVWFRHDLRLADNPALAAAAASGAPVLPVYALDDETPGEWRLGGAGRWWLHHALEALGRDLAALGAPLVLRRGRGAAVLIDLARETGAVAVHWNRCYEPYATARDAALKSTLRKSGIAAESHNAALLFEPWTVATGAGGPYKVFTPFWKACRAMVPPAPVPAPRALHGFKATPPSDVLNSWRLLPRAPDWAGGLRAAWRPGEAAAQARLAAFLDGSAASYGAVRDRPGEAGTSRLSPHLRFGEIGPRQIWHAALSRQDGSGDAGRETFLKELGWREFAYHLLFHFPHTTGAPFRPDFAHFPWRRDAAALRAWQQGQTGYPIVDAGMRQLWSTGWMHNRVRMIAASFLTKHLLLPWQSGAAWFWDTLVDADLAANTAGWQWVAGSGADAAPYFRIFNPMLQGEKFDPEGAYVRAFVPELARLPARWLHRPWAAPAKVLAGAGVDLGRDYPRPLVDHGAARARALAARAARTAENRR